MLITKRLRHILNNIEVIKVFLTCPSNITFLFSFFKLLSINNIYNEEYLRAGMDIAVPISNDYFTTYTVNSGDNLYAIARRYNINTTLLAALNGLNMDDYIYPNQKIMIPKSGYSFYITKDGDTLNTVADKFKRSVNELTSMNQTIYLLPGQLMINRTK